MTMDFLKSSIIISTKINFFISNPCVANLPRAPATSLFLTPTCCMQGVTRLDGARGKKQVWRPHVRSWGLLEANVLHWRKYLWHCWDVLEHTAAIRRPPAVIWCHHNDSAPANCAPLAPLRYAPGCMLSHWFKSLLFTNHVSGETRPVATEGIRGQCPHKFFCAPQILLFPKKIVSNM